MVSDYQFHWLCFEAKIFIKKYSVFLLLKYQRLLQTIQNCMRFWCQIWLLPEIFSTYRQLLLMNILPTVENIAPVDICTFVLNPTWEYALLIIKTMHVPNWNFVYIARCEINPPVWTLYFSTVLKVPVVPRPPAMISSESLDKKNISWTFLHPGHGRIGSPSCSQGQVEHCSWQLSLECYGAVFSSSCSQEPACILSAPTWVLQSSDLALLQPGTS